MADIMTPALGESVSEATVARWTKKPGESVRKDEILVELETDKVSLEVAAPADGVLESISAEEGATVEPGAVLGRVREGAAASTPAAAPAPSAPKVAKPAPAAPAPAPAPAAAASAAPVLAPSAQRIATEGRLDPAAIAGTGKGGRVTKADALAALEARAAAPPPAPAPAAPREAHAREERIRMTRLRQTIARRLKEAQQTAAMLTTFNEVDMSAVMALRNTYKDAFEKTHGVKLGFMGFFVRACIHALKSVPEVNAEIDGQDLIYKNHYDIGVAVGTERGLVVPVVRDADTLSLAGIEKAIGDLGKKARDGALALDDLQGGTFTISNGGVYGSLMSTPILNAPQSGILGMHKIQERPVAVNGQVVIRPMMYLALSYDHRIVDGQGAVTFLVRVKEAIEDPQRLLLDI
ncbi:MAG: 2-oxoglutarate dehydrogenase complex dihydrolipoyllysine-residue succinyltransferase [Phenylobacterium sp.]|uniref:2-oxoglutarate dehydrogenase complex dihydrolipoyllysine-residue succinyltransferase n=1 Tax=Phenylobacterium sp. TaxID=1871053 RepID=UPI0025D33232|nr:2-oxoglutarate dehydrogenase complex dihydrolipoyllysine-residue succinyltransferase [Phenylobacterium sp.]MCA6225189.1 2-oxoglutarate dehydrogenase complex dihydrolipoyllysine-residue succinyltransferase [Phenylobacterium sp.]MCA6227507.1 2-oxoglutarate dehydrogenase complex dihydrolipoyllysine-residue succinyltransferase [Phenylobacterium sp.]MCA6230938.1 2-oxoglutarate dehydrogenase complex dihydrolipoyllysine-residue succinyltransferase [Phenylobacterium sp.]MCA6234210.1 2-oxoglutarate d